MSDLMIPGQLPKLEPRIVGIVGAAGSGKDTVAGFILEIFEGEHISLASPFKEFAGKVFDFTADQLYGPSASRNGCDPRYSYDNQPAWSIDFTSRYRGVNGVVARMLDWWKPERIAPPPRPFTIEQIDKNRAQVWGRYNQHEIAFLRDVLPSDIDIEFGRVQLRKVMSQILHTRNISPRLVLQLIGSEFGRAISPNIWADRCLRRAQEIVRGGRSALITDVRFLNEAEKFHDVGATLLFLVCPQVEALTTGVAGHVSEEEMKSPRMQAFISKQLFNDKTKGLQYLRGLVHGLFFDA